MFYLCSLNISSIFSSPSCMLTHVIQVQNWRKCVEFQPRSSKRRLEKLVYFFLLDCTWDMNLYATFPLKLGDLFTVLEGGHSSKCCQCRKDMAGSHLALDWGIDAFYGGSRFLNRLSQGWKKKITAFYCANKMSNVWPIPQVLSNKLIWHDPL